MLNLTLTLQMGVGDRLEGKERPVRVSPEPLRILSLWIRSLRAPWWECCWAFHTVISEMGTGRKGPGKFYLEPVSFKSSLALFSGVANGNSFEGIYSKCRLKGLGPGRKGMETVLRSAEPVR